MQNNFYIFQERICFMLLKSQLFCYIIKRVNFILLFLILWGDVKLKECKFALFLICIFLLLLSTVAFAAEFPDVPHNHPNKDAIDFLSDNGVVAGYEDGSFVPDKEITRTEFCALVARTTGYGKTEYEAVELPFSDVPEDYWGKNHISFCYERGLVNGMGDGIFNPAHKVTYEQVIKIAVCVIGEDEEATKIIGDKWYSGYVEVAEKSGLLNNVNVELGQNTPRKEAVQVVYNAIMLKNEKEENEEDEAKEDDESEEEKSQLELEYEKKDFSDVNVILLDAGHNFYGKDIGARNEELDLKEEEITWQIANRVQKKLKKLGYSVVMTRETLESSIGANTSTIDSLQARVDLAHEHLADLYVSIHCNTGGGKGAETYCFEKGGYSERLATLIQKNFRKDEIFYDRGVKTANFYVIKNTLMPAVLIEAGFLDDEADIEIISSKKGQEKIASAITNAIVEYDRMKPLEKDKLRDDE